VIETRMNVVNGYDQMISDENAHVIFDVADPYLINKIDPLFRSRRIKYMPEATVDNARSLVRRDALVWFHKAKNGDSAQFNDCTVCRHGIAACWRCFCSGYRMTEYDEEHEQHHRCLCPWFAHRSLFHTFTSPTLCDFSMLLIHFVTSVMNPVFA